MSHAHRASYGSIADTYRTGIPPSGVVGAHYVGVGGGSGGGGGAYAGAGSGGGGSGAPYHSAGSGQSERVREPFDILLSILRGRFTRYPFGQYKILSC